MSGNLPILLMIIAAILCFLVISGVINGYEDYQWRQQIHSYFDLSDQASSLAKKLEFLEKFKQALIWKELNSGDARYIFKTPQTKMEVQMEILETLLERLRKAETLNTDSLEYQQAIRQITGDEYQGFNTCLFRDRWRRQYFLRWLFTQFGTCQSGKYAGEDKDM